MNAAELGVGLLILTSAFLSMAAGIGVLRFPDVLTRLHAATKPQVLGVAVVLLTIVLRVPTWGVLSSVILITCGIGGAYLWGPKGAAWGLAGASFTTLLLWWNEAHRAIAAHRRAAAAA